MKNNELEKLLAQEPNAQARRHGGGKLPIWERDLKLKKAIEEIHEAVFGAALGSAKPGSLEK